ncbi:hypothetical protein BJY01DRAFT_251064 [Aspergillus pseudoustus]|uniref:Major facilitator superfamily domain-containing protein n=1 Tax=Aspergillus pseudoustus TaxID=1810923 RepID=A0ABR4JE78_9EURO
MASPILFLLLPILVHAQNHTAANGTVDRVGWTSSPDVRGTADILWSCGAIFLVCTWKCMHFNLPSQEESEAQWRTFWGWFPYWPSRLRWSVIVRQVKWMCMIAIAPEFGIAMAADEFWQAWKLTRKVGCAGFTITHAFYALMGGFVIAVPAETNSQAQAVEAKPSSDATESAPDLPTPDLRKLEYFSIISISPPPAQHSDHPEDYELIDSVAVATIFPSVTQESASTLFFPRVTEEDIKNQAKSDPLTKALAILQCTWLIIQSIARTSQGLRLTELELTTLAFTACAFTMYTFWWCKPFDAQRPIQLLCLDSKTASQVRSNLRPWTVEERSPTTSKVDHYLFGVMDVFSWKWTAEFGQSIIFHTSAVIFSAIHLIAWNWDFPSPVVRILWRSSAVGATCLPLFTLACLTPMGALGNVLDSAFGDEEKFVPKSLTILMGIVSIGAIVSYFACRVGLIVLIFYCFTDMPASVYQTPSWHNVFPHFS